MTVLVVGETLVDVVHRSDGTVTRSPGGGPANVAITLGRLGVPVKLLTELADDADGVEARSWLEASGVQVLAQPPAQHRTSTATASLDASGSASYEFDIQWSLSWNLETISEVDVVHVGSLAALLAPGAAAVEALVSAARDAAVTYDPNIRPALIANPTEARTRIEGMVAAARVVKASEDDLAWLYPDDDPLSIAQRWCASGPDLVAVTLGAAGALALTRDQIVRVSASSVSIVDTVGAGDTVMGTLIAELLTVGSPKSWATLDHTTIEHVLGRCMANAAITVSRPGADPPWARESSIGTADVRLA
jgi:fructokinase